MKKETDINIDALLRDTFLTVVELRQGTTVRHGMELYRHCQRQVELVRERLKDAGFSRENVEHITYAQCALLDETVLSRSGMDDGQTIWMKDPLQSHFFNTLQAGELLYERMKQVLQELRPRAGRADLLSPCPAAGISRALSGSGSPGARPAYFDAQRAGRAIWCAAGNGGTERAVIHPSAPFAAFAIFLAGNTGAATGGRLVGATPLAECTGG